jgi:hypothetical protein
MFILLQNLTGNGYGKPVKNPYLQDKALTLKTNILSKSKNRKEPKH